MSVDSPVIPEELTRETHRAAWAALVAGESYGGAAKAAGVSRRTVYKWLAKWRAVWGSDLFVENGRQGYERTAPARAVAKDRWAVARIELERSTGVVAGALLEKLTAAIDGIEVSDLSTKELRELAVTYGILVDKGQVLSGSTNPRFDAKPPTPLEDVDRKIAKMLDDAEAILAAEGALPAGDEPSTST